MSDYLRVKFREKLQAFGMEAFVAASDRVTLRKAVDPRRPGEGIEAVTDDGRGNISVEFVSLDLVSSITFAPVKGTAPVAAAEAAPAKAAK
jgi:hypothetical protein